MEGTRSKWTIGIDVSAEEFVAAVFCPGDHSTLLNRVFENSQGGMDLFLGCLATHHIAAEQTLICLEATGVYSESLSYRLHAEGWSVAVEAPQKVKRAFYKKQKSDPVDAQQIAEYAWRFADQLRLWEPQAVIVEELRALLSAREQHIGYRTAEINSLKALQRKAVISEVAHRVHRQTISQLNEQISLVEAEIKRLLREDGGIGGYVEQLQKIPGVGLLMIANLVVLTNGFAQKPQASSFAAWLGISPYLYQSGQSVRRRSRSSGYGPSRMRKLLYMASLNRKRWDEGTAEYYQRKKAEGKPGRLILNNIANKLIRLICALLRDMSEYDPNYRAQRV
jgi:transposase